MAEILLYGVIGNAEEGLDAKTVTSAIRSSSGPLSVRINSGGGYVMDGLAIVEALRAYRDQVTIYIDGLAASMASVIAMVGDETIIAESGLIMVHKPWDASIGNADALREDAAKLDKVEAQIIAIYAKKTRLPQARLRQMLAAETWLDATEALKLGFVTGISRALKLAAMVDCSAYGFRNTPSHLKERDMPNGNEALAQAATAERERITTIMNLCRKAHLGEDFAQGLIDKATPLPQAREQIVDALAARDEVDGVGHLNHNGELGGHTFANPNFQAKAMGDALYSRLTGKAPEGAAREMMSLSMVDMARIMAEARGVRGARTMRPEQVLSAAAWNGGRFGGSAAITHTTSDFPDLLTAAGQRFLLDVYKAAASPLKLIGRPRTATDFRPIFGLQLSNFGTLPQVGEDAEIPGGTFKTRKNSYSLATFAKQFSLTRQAIINDDLGAFSDVMTIMARAAAETEAQLLANLLISNPVMDDTVALFHATHGNLAGTGGASAISTLSAGRLAMRSQMDMDGVTPISSAPKFILSGPAEETVIEQLLTQTSPVGTADVNPFAGKLTPLVDPRLSGTAWYLFADPAITPTLEYANLNGFEGPTVEQKDGWDTLGQSFRVYQDFGAGFVDYRGAYKNVGA